MADERALLSLLSGKWVTAALAAAAELGLADVLAERALTAEALAAELGCSSEALVRLLRVLGGEGLLEVGLDGRYTLTALGALLKTGQLRELARFTGAGFSWAPWAELAGAVRTNRAAFELAHKSSLFEYLDQHPRDAELYHAAVDAFTRRQARALAETFDFRGAQRLVDVGGGLGTLLVELRARWPHLHCILFDRPKVIAQAKEGPAAQLFGERFSAQAGDFLEGVPQGADVYVLKHVLHNWDDASAQTLLGHCVDGLNPGGHVLVVESLVLPGNRRDGTALFDLEMLALCGPGRERKKPEFRRLLYRAGLKLLSTHDLAGMARLMVTRPL